MSFTYRPRLWFLCCVIACAGLLGFASYLQVRQHIEPCPLCILQRVCYFAIAFFALLGCLYPWKKVGIRLYSLLIGLSAVAGAMIAGRQVWLQHLPPEQISGCGPSLGVMLKNYPLGQTIKLLLTGTAECAKVEWQFLSLSMAEWSLICFIVFLLFAILQSIAAKAK